MFEKIKTLFKHNRSKDEIVSLCYPGVDVKAATSPLPGETGPLDGYWEEGYHYYIEIKGKKLIVRDYAKRVQLETVISYDPESADSGKNTLIHLEKCALSYTGYGEPMSWISELRYTDGELVMDYYYTIMGTTEYKLKKAEGDPFRNILILDDDYLPLLQGKWVDGTDSSVWLLIKNDTLCFGFREHADEAVPIHVTAYVSNPRKIYIRHASLTTHDLGMYSDLEIGGGMLKGYMQVTDTNVPPTCFVRECEFGTIELPDEAYRPAVNTMVDHSVDEEN